MSCNHSKCFLEDFFFMETVERYLSTDMLKSSGFEPVTSFSSDFVNSKENALIRRSDVAVCLIDEELITDYFKTGRMNRRTCEAFQVAGQAFLRRWAEYRQSPPTSG